MKATSQVALPIAVSLVGVLIALALTAVGTGSRALTDHRPALPQRPPPTGLIRPRDLADSLHLVIAADRELYCRLVIRELTADREALATAADRAPHGCLPPPSLMLRRAAESVQSQGAEFSYALRSLNPFNPRNGPQTEVERAGLEFVAHHPSQNYYRQETLGGRRYFTAVYPDVAIASTCVNCHNRRPASSRRHDRVGDVLGGLVVRVALEF